MATHDDEGRAPRAAVTAVRETGEPLRIGETGEDAANGDTAIVARNERTQEGYHVAVCGCRYRGAVHQERVLTQRCRYHISQETKAAVKNTAISLARQGATEKLIQLRDDWAHVVGLIPFDDAAWELRREGFHLDDDLAEILTGGFFEPWGSSEPAPSVPLLRGGAGAPRSYRGHDHER